MALSALVLIKPSCGQVAESPTSQALHWYSSLVEQTPLWQDHMNGALVSSENKGLRIEIAPGKTWAIAAVPRALLPTQIGIIRVRVRSVSNGGKWLVRLRGAMQGKAIVADYGPFQGQTTTGLHTLKIDPRLLQLKQRPAVQVQLGLEGPAGAAAVFESLEFLSGIAAKPLAKAQPGQKPIEAVELMPNIPQPFHIIDWRQRALDYDKFVFDFQNKGQYLPLIWLDNAQVNIKGPTFGLCSYVGDSRQGTSHQEGVNCLGAVLGATLVGIDKSRQDYNYVQMSQAFYNVQNGNNLVLNDTRGQTGGSFWYEIWPHVLFYALADRYPHEPNMTNIVQTTANRWCEAYTALGGSATATPNFDHTAFNFKTMQAVDYNTWKEPDAAAGMAWLEYAAWNRFHDAKYLQTTEGALRFLEQRQDNPYYEVLLPWGALTAARLNADQGRHYDVNKLLNWSFGISDCRGGWGVIVNRWGDYDCAGLVGSVDNRGGYAFAMNTYAQAGALAPLARYDARYARAIGKWMLNLTNAARLFYTDGLPSEHQSPPQWKEDTNNVIAYEGLRREWQGKVPCATGDPVAMKWGPATDRGLYGSSYVGILGAIVQRTSDEKILALDCLATDFYRQPAYPTKLYYNPYSQKKQVIIPLGAGRHDLYDAASKRFLARNVTGQTKISIEPDSAVLMVQTPSGGKMTRQERKMLIDGVVVDYGVTD